jgi:hypothetical protein
MGLGEYLKPVIGIGAALIGGELAGPIGGAIGWGLGMGVGGALFPPEAEKTAAQSMGPAQLFKATSDYGMAVPVLRGCRRTGGNLIWHNVPVLITSAAQVPDYINYLAAITIKNGGTAPAEGEEKYACTFAYGVCHGIAHTLKVYEEKNEYLLVGNHGYLLNEGQNVPPEYRMATYDEQVALVLAKGTPPSFHCTQYSGSQVVADSKIVEAKGLGVVPPYRNLHYIVFMDFPMLTNSIPQLSFETTRMECSDNPASVVVYSYGDGRPQINVSDHYGFYKYATVQVQRTFTGSMIVPMFDMTLNSYDKTIDGIHSWDGVYFSNPDYFVEDVRASVDQQQQPNFSEVVAAGITLADYASGPAGERVDDNGILEWIYDVSYSGLIGCPFNVQTCVTHEEMIITNSAFVNNTSIKMNGVEVESATQNAHTAGTYTYCTHNTAERYFIGQLGVGMQTRYWGRDLKLQASSYQDEENYAYIVSRKDYDYSSGVYGDGTNPYGWMDYLTPEPLPAPGPFIFNALDPGLTVYSYLVYCQGGVQTEVLLETHTEAPGGYPTESYTWDEIVSAYVHVYPNMTIVYSFCLGPKSVGPG